MFLVAVLVLLARSCASSSTTSSSSSSSSRCRSCCWGAHSSTVSVEQLWSKWHQTDLKMSSTVFNIFCFFVPIFFVSLHFFMPALIPVPPPRGGRGPNDTLHEIHHFESHFVNLCQLWHVKFVTHRCCNKPVGRHPMNPISPTSFVRGDRFLQMLRTISLSLR